MVDSIITAILSRALGLSSPGRVSMASKGKRIRTKMKSLVHTVHAIIYESMIPCILYPTATLESHESRNGASEDFLKPTQS